MSFLDRYKTDKALEVDGVWVDFGDGVKFKVARLNNKKARGLRKQLERPYKNLPEVPEEAAETILTKVMAQAVVLDWEGDVDGNNTQFTPAAAEKLMNEYPDLRQDLIMVAMSRDTFKKEQDAAVEGNSASA